MGTDGDGVNDAYEGNQFGPIDGTAVASPYVFDMFSTGVKTFIIAGNTFGIDIHGNPFPNCSFDIGSFGLNSGTQVRFGSDFNGVSDALEANILNNNNVFSTQFPNPYYDASSSLFQSGMSSAPGAITNAWVSVRGNVMVNNCPTFNPDLDATYFINWYSNYVAYTTQFPVADDSIPVLSGSSTVSTLSGTFTPPNSMNGYTNVVLDLYVPDPEGQVNGALFELPSFGGSSGWGFVQGKTYLGSYLIPNPASGAFSWDISGLGLAHGTQVTVAITYSSFGRPNLTSIIRNGSQTTLTWTGANGGPFALGTQDTQVTEGLPVLSGAPAGGFGVQRASSLSGPGPRPTRPATALPSPMRPAVLSTALLHRSPA